MGRHTIKIIVLAFLLLTALSSPSCRAQAQQKSSYPAMAPLDQYLIPDEASEIALARSAAPPSISDAAEVMVLRRDGYQTAANGSNGFMCLVERSWATATDNPEFWNPKLRAPHCFNAAAAKSFAPIFLMKTKLVLAGKSPTEIAAAINSALDQHQLPALEPGAMCYMMSKQQYLNDDGKSWHPHLMLFVSGDAEKTWGANLPASPLISVNDAQERVTVFMVVVPKWSDGTPASK
jgi:hypothetical protein